MTAAATEALNRVISAVANAIAPKTPTPEPPGPPQQPLPPSEPADITPKAEQPSQNPS